MPHFFLLLFKINIVLALFGAAYFFVLRRLTYYTLNRLFLIFGILFASIYPFIDLTTFFLQQNQDAIGFVPALNKKATEILPAQFFTVNWQTLAILFYVGVFFMAGRLLMQFVSLYKMHKKSRRGNVNNRAVRILDEPVSPFSFWQTIYINPALHEKEELATILDHEHIHVKQWHSLDIILAELSVVFYWFNPGVWLMKKAVKENLEFITDQKILHKGIDKKTYQYSLLQVGNLNATVRIVNNFNLSDLKKRIKMMNTNRSSRLTLSRYLLLVPTLLVITLVFTMSTKATDALAPLHSLMATLVKDKKNANLPEPHIAVKHLPTSQKSAKTITRSTHTTIKIADSTAIKEPVAIFLTKTTGSSDILPKLKGIVAGIEIKNNADTAIGKTTIHARRGSSFIGPEKNDEITIIGKPAKVMGIKLVGFATQEEASKQVDKYAITVNGKRMPAEKFNTVDPENITSMKMVQGIPVSEIQIKTKSNN